MQLAPRSRDLRIDAGVHAEQVNAIMDAISRDLVVQCFGDMDADCRAHLARFLRPIVLVEGVWVFKALDVGMVSVLYRVQVSVLGLRGEGLSRVSGSCISLCRSQVGCEWAATCCLSSSSP